MKFLFSIAAIAALLTPVHGVFIQCAAKRPDNIFESSGFLTADFTQKACAASGGSIDPNRRGNMKCCNVPDNRQGDFTSSCNGQKAGSNFQGFHPTTQPCWTIHNDD